MHDEALTNRDRDVLRCLADDLSNQEIAERLSIATATVKWHIRQLNAKFHTSNRIELVARAHQWHLLDDERVLHNAPVQATPFVGRESDISQIVEQLTASNVRLLTLLGPGGIGKTRLAMKVANRCATEFVGGAVFVPLQGMNDERLFVSKIAEVVGLHPSNRQTAQQNLEKLARYLEQNPMLVVLDNIEHLLDASPALSELLQQTSGTIFLITSRERLNLQEEHVYLVQGLPFPVLATPADEIDGYDAVQLFAERAKRVYRDFTLANEAEAVVHICQVVEGMPLALELAASWRSILSCADIAAELKQNMDVLSTKLRNVPERHRSIKIVFDQTWHFLSEKDRQVYKCLSVFQGGFQREAAQKIAGASLLSLSALTDKSIIRLDETGRYHMHELTRQYGAERLAEEPAEQQAVQVRYAHYFADYVHDRLSDISHGQQLTAAIELRTDLDNIRAALKWAFHAQSTLLIARLCCESLVLFFQYESRYLEALQIYHQAAEILSDKVPSLDVQHALLDIYKGVAWFHLRLGHFDDVITTAQRGFDVYTTLNVLPQNVHLSNPQCIAGFAMLARSNYERAIEIATQSIQQGEYHNKPIDIQFGHYLLADAYQAQGQLELAFEHAQASYKITQDYGDRWFAAYVLHKLGALSSRLAENCDAARRYVLESYEIREPFGDVEGMALSLSYLGDIELKEKNFDEAYQCFERSMVLYQKTGDTGGIATACRGLGISAYMKGDAANAQRYILQALDLAVEIKYLSLLSVLFTDLSHVLWQSDHLLHSMTLLTFVRKDSADQANRTMAEIQIQKYQENIDVELFAAAVVRGKTATLQEITAELRPFLLSVEIFQRDTQLVSDDVAKDGIDQLTPRELEVLALVAEGLSNQEIADKLIIAVGTVKYYTAQIYSKLDVNSRIQAVQKAQQQHLI